VFDILSKLEEQGVCKISSAELGKSLGQTAHTVRKDIHFLGIAGVAGAKYEINDLKELIARHLGFNRPKKCCIVGLGRLGSALLEHILASKQNAVDVVAGFDSNVNRIETIQTPIKLYPSYQITETVKRLGIELALIAVPSKEAQEVADRCCEGGITGLLNFTNEVIRPTYKNVVVRSVAISSEMRILSAQAFVNTSRTE
jgi:redox-sensing transcriptional repressor